ncbi:MAG: hypothetical protein FJY67_03035 [Calditrichaeota bacterium]|nr:hypothetical protein [Calditrichota bacterium]
MNKKAIIGILIAIVAVGFGWTIYHNPARKAQVMPVPGQSTSKASADAVMAIAAKLHCPDSCCVGKEITVAESKCASSADIRESIRMMLDAGLSQDGVVMHLAMMGVEVPGGSVAMPPGHPPMDGSAMPGESHEHHEHDGHDHGSEPPAKKELPEGHPKLPEGHPSVGN